MPLPSFYEADAVEQIAINLFHGWGYNFYRLENQLRADDLMVRAKVGWLLGQARASVDSAESAFRHEFLPPPTRAKPYPDAAAVAGARALEQLSTAIGALEGQIRAQPVPENDRMTQRYRREGETLQGLLACDQVLVGRCELLRGLLDHKSGVWINENSRDIAAGLGAIEAALRERQAVLLM
jgi:hypothetical protein